VLELLLKKWLPICQSLRITKFFFGKQLRLLKEGTILLRTFRPFALVAMVNIGL
jgi:hypothetical protein